MLRLHRTKLLGVVFTAGQEFHAGLVDGVYTAAEALGYDVVLSCVTPHRDENRAVRTLLDDRCEALVLIGTELLVRELVDLDARIPVVAIARRVRVSTRCAVTTSRARAWQSRTWPGSAIRRSPIWMAVARRAQPSGVRDSADRSRRPGSPGRSLTAASPNARALVPPQRC